jgi:hypothetical protein
MVVVYLAVISDKIQNSAEFLPEFETLASTMILRNRGH